MKKPFFAMVNTHSEHCGEPPVYRNSIGKKYYGYFENFFGDQWVFVYDRETKTAELRGGDVGWDAVYTVTDGRVEGLVLNQEEFLWLHSCWASATGKRAYACRSEK